MKYKYTTHFDATIFASKEVKTFDEHKKESLASLKDMAPTHYESKNVDLLAVAFDGAVINQFNANDDGISSSTAVGIKEQFVHKPINVEHDRSNIIGHITDVAFTDRSTHDYIWDDRARGKNEPFNLTLGGFVYKMVNSDFYEELEESMDSSSTNFHSISASWEVGFNSFGIAVGSEELQHCEIITNPIEVAKLAPNLRAFGGSGLTIDGKRIYRLILGEVFPLGMGFVKNPAADVRGIHSYNEEEEEEESSEARPITAEKDDFITNKEPYISQSEKNNVKSHDLKKSMDLLKQLQEALANQEKVTEEVAANITAKFADLIRKSDDEYRQKLDEKEQAVTDANKKQEELENSVADIQSKLSAAEEKIKTFEEVQAEEALATARDQRLETLDSLYELDNDDRKVIIEDLASIDVTSDEVFEVYANRLAIILRHKNKESIAKVAAEAKEAKDLEEAKASTEGDKVSEEDKLDDAAALAKAKANVDEGIVNNDGGGEKSLVERMRGAFSKENVKITL
jgi:hypothetical protein